MPFAAAGAGLGAVGSIVGGGKQASATKKAAQLEANSANHATDIQKQEFDTQQSNIAPWLSAGKDALSTLTGKLPDLTTGFDPTKAGVPASFSFDPSTVANDPAFKFAMDQGMKAIQRGAAAKGDLLGGATQKALADYGAGTASQYENQDFNEALSKYKTNYSNAFDTFNSNQSNVFNRLASVAGVGQTANNQLGTAGQNFANQAGQNIMAAGNAGAAGVVGAANAGAGAWGGIASSVASMPAGNPFSSSYWHSGSGSSGGTGGGVGNAVGNVSDPELG